MYLRQQHLSNNSTIHMTTVDTATRQSHEHLSLEIPITDVILLFFAMIGLTVVGILIINQIVFLTPFRVTVVAAFATGVLLRLTGVRGLRTDRRMSRGLLYAVVVGLFLAGTLAPHYVGGQDQGYYSAMSEMLARGQPIVFVDPLRASLPQDLLQIDNSTKLWSVQSFSGGRQALEFYTLHPALMALSVQLLGKGFHTAFMLLCFAVTIVLVFLLVLELSKSMSSAVLAAFLIAVNPAFVFFAKFPVTEITTGTFLVLSMYFLLRSFHSLDKRTMMLYGAGAVAAMTAFCFVRMSFPEIAPFLLALSGAMFFISGVRVEQRLLILVFTILSFGCFALSLVYYHAMIPGLFWGIVESVYRPAIYRARWLIAAGAAVGSLVLAGLFLPVSREKTASLITAILNWAQRTILLSPGIVMLVVALPSIGSLVRSGTLDAFTFTSQAPQPGWHIVRFHALYVLMLFMSPPLFALLMTGLRPLPDKQRMLVLPCFFLISIWPAYMTFASSIPYLYYYGRYLVPEVLPAAIIACVMIVDIGRLPRAITVVLVVLGIAWSLFFSIVQLPHREGEAERPFHEIAERLSPLDILVIDGELTNGQRSQLIVPLRYALGIPTFVLPTGTVEQRLNVLRRLRSSTRGQMYFLSWSEPLSVKLRAMGFDRVDSFPFNLNLMRASSDPAKLAAWVLPYRRTVAKGSDLVLHRIPDRPLVRLEPGQRIMMSEAGLGYLLVQEGWSGQEVSARWTEGKKARLTLPISNDVWPDSPLRLTLFASTFQPQTVEFFVGGKLLQRRRLGPTPEEITLDIQFDAIRDGKLDLILLLPDAHSPKSAGTDGDARELGLSLRWIRFDPK